MWYICIKYVSSKYNISHKVLCQHRSKFLRCFCFKKNILEEEKVSEVQVSKQEKYCPKDVESRWYEWWESKNYFKPKTKQDLFVVLLPPPNVTGNLHLGHALTLTLQDIILRWKRMKGESVLWIPGIDHAGIATQSVVEKHLYQTLGVSKHDLGKAEFLKIVEEWKNTKENQIIKQLRKMGASLDWSRLIYTMDSSHSQLVTNSFIQLYNEGLIYRKKDLVNWSCALRSSVSDIEVDYIEANRTKKISVPGYEKPVDFGVMYEFAYKVCDEDDEIVVATTRPETMLGDVAIAVHPENSALSKFINKYVWHPFRKEKIPVIGDPFVVSDRGTGAVKITPAHSPIDYEVALRHNLKAIEVINEEGLVKKVGHNEKFHGLKRFDARNVIISELKALGLFRKYKSHEVRIPVCSRSGDVIEWTLKNQWFLKCSSLARKAVDAVESGHLKLEPKSYCKVWNEWLNSESIRDWNLSRQLWWGHPIPMYECEFQDDKIWVPGLSPEEAKSKAAERFKAFPEDVKVVQDPDVLDTWFSSGLLPLNPVIDQENQSPISLMVTGHDILFFWVARMVMLSIQLRGTLPFNEVFLHSLICDAKGKKMSKSLGNVISPEEIMNGCSLTQMKEKLEKDHREGIISDKNFQNALISQKKMFPKGIPECGVDGLRFTLCSTNFQSALVNFDIELCRSSRFFCNKIYQAMNYFIKVTDKYRGMRSEFDLAELKAEKEKLNCFDRWILSRLADTVKRVDDSISNYSFHFGTTAIRLFFVENFCSVYLESSKKILAEASPLEYRICVSVLFHCFEYSLRLLSPFMPYVTEYLYHALPPLKGFDRYESVMIAEYPKLAHFSEFRDVELENQFGKILNVLSVLRKAKMLLQLKETMPNVFVKCPDEMARILFGETGYVFRMLLKIGEMSRVENLKRSNVLQQMVMKDCTVLIEHSYDRTALKKLLDPDIKRESELKENVHKLSLDENKISSREKLIRTQKLHALTLELNRIQEFKAALDSCDR